MSMKKINSLSDIADLYDFLFLDMYGVLWDGTALYPDIIPTLQSMRQMGKKVYILSNATTVGELFQSKLAQLGLKLGQHYDGVITSGDVLAEKLQHHFFRTIGRRLDYKFYVIGRHNPMLLWSEIEHQVHDVSSADFVYVGSLIMNGVYPITLDAFEPDLQKALNKKIPLVCANPDYQALHGDLKYYCSGGVADWYEKHGGTVHWIGKPYSEIYAYVKQKTGADFKRSVMIGDTLRTDIAGASTAGMDTVLITEHGMTADEISNGISLSDLCAKENVMPTYVLDKVK